MEPLEEIKKNIDSGKLLIGQNETLRNLKIGRVEKVFLASNSDSDVKKEVGYYCELSKTPLTILEIPNDELGIVCKKQFSISVLCLLK